MTKTTMTKTQFQKNNGKWSVVSRTQKEVGLEFYENILKDPDVFGGTPRNTKNWCAFGIVDSRTFYSPDGQEKSVYSFE